MTDYRYLCKNCETWHDTAEEADECCAWFFTFGSTNKAGSVELNHRFVRINGTHDEAETKMVEARGRLWEGQIKIADLPYAIKIWNLTEEISLDEVRLCPIAEKHKCG